MGWPPPSPVRGLQLPQSGCSTPTCFASCAPRSASPTWPCLPLASTTSFRRLCLPFWILWPGITPRWRSVGRVWLRFRVPSSSPVASGSQRVSGAYDLPTAFGRSFLAGAAFGSLYSSSLQANLSSPYHCGGASCCFLSLVDIIRLRGPFLCTCGVFAEGVRGSWVFGVAAKAVAQAHRSSTRALSAPQWDSFVSSCTSQGVVPAPSTPQIVSDFVLHLRRSRSLRGGTIATYVSAINTVLAATSGVRVGSAPEVSAILRGFPVGGPAPEVSAPAWDLNVVLRFCLVLLLALWWMRRSSGFRRRRCSCCPWLLLLVSLGCTPWMLPR